MTDPIYTIEGSMHRMEFPGGERVEGLRPQLDHLGRLLTRVTAFLPNGNLAHRARIDLLNQREIEQFHQIAVAMDGQFNRDWRGRLLCFQQQVLHTLETPEAGEEANDPEDAVHPFPVEVLPAPVARFVTTAAEALPCPPDFLAVPLLAVLGAAIGTTRMIEIKPGWREGARLWTAVVADPGSKKSPALDLVLQPVYAVQRDRTGSYADAQKAYEQALAQYELEYAAWKKQQQARATDKPGKPEEPGFPQVCSTDATVEALAAVLEQNPRGLLFARDELTGRARAMNQYKGGKGADRQAWLSFWNGAQVVVNRKTRKDPIVVQQPFVGVAGCLPPDVLGELADAHGREDGFLHRILFAFPPPQGIAWTEASIAPAVQKGYARVVWQLYALSFGQDDSPVVVQMTPGGKAAFVEWANTHYAELGAPDLPPHLHGPWAKLEGYCARLALVLQLARQACREAPQEAVDDTSVFSAAALVDYFKSHARAVYARLHATPADRRVAAARQWIVRHGGEATVRDLYRYKVAGCHTRTEAEQVLMDLVAHGYGDLADDSPPGGGHRRKVFRAHTDA